MNFIGREHQPAALVFNAVGRAGIRNKMSLQSGSITLGREPTACRPGVEYVHGNGRGEARPWSAITSQGWATALPTKAAFVSTLELTGF